MTPCADLDGRVGHQQEHWHAGIRRLQHRDDVPPSTDATAFACTGDLARHRVELVGLVAQHHQVGALGDLDGSIRRLASELRGERPCPSGAAVGAQHGIAPASRECARHVASADQADDIA